jgi:hypothetical protein
MIDQAVARPVLRVVETLLENFQSIYLLYQYPLRRAEGAFLNIRSYAESDYALVVSEKLDKFLGRHI